MVKIVQLNICNLEKIIEVESGAFIPPLQASRQKIIKRLSLNHFYFGAEIDSNLVGTLAFRYSTFSLINRADFPRTFEEFVNHPNTERSNAILVYSLGILPEYRGKNSALKLLNEAFEFAKRSGIEYVFGDGRCPSYNGSNDFPQERIEKSQEFKESIDECIAHGFNPSVKELLKDSTLAFYIKFVGLKPLKLIPNFIPEDKPAGGHRVILYKKSR